MTWDLGSTGLALMAALALGFGAVGGVLSGGSLKRRVVGAVITTVACFGTGLFTSEWFFGWATEEDLQPNIDGLSRDEVLLSSLLTTVAVVGVLRVVARRRRARTPDVPSTVPTMPAQREREPAREARGPRHRA